MVVDFLTRIQIQVGLWANQGNKQSLVFRAFDSNGDGTGDAITMDAGDTFTITLSAKRAYGEIGVALLNSPTATASWTDKTNNSIAHCILAGPNGPESGNNWAPWKVIRINNSTDGHSNLLVRYQTTLIL